MKVLNHFRASFRNCFSLLFAVLAGVVTANPGQAQGYQSSTISKFVIFSADEDADTASMFIRVLRGKGKVERILKANSLDKAAASEAEVLILWMPHNQPSKLDPKTLNSLKNKKIVGIGAGAARLFQDLGLLIHFNHCETFGGSPPDIYISKSVLLGAPKFVAATKILEPVPDQKPDRTAIDSFGMFIPADSDLISKVDVIARFTGDSNYAPLVRQRNFILVGVPVPPVRWSNGFTSLVNEACHALAERKFEAPTLDAVPLPN